jgi:hypothetical protein
LRFRLIPAIWAIIDVAIAMAILRFWHASAYSLLWWLRGLPVMLFLLFGVQSAGIALFAPGDTVRRRVDGDWR